MTFAAIAVVQYRTQHLQTDQLFNLLFVGGKVYMQMQSHIYQAPSLNFKTYENL